MKDDEAYRKVEKSCDQGHKGEPLKDDEAYCNVEKSFDKALT